MARRTGAVVAAVCALLLGVLAVPAHAEPVVFVDDTPSPGWTVDGTVYATLIVGDTIFVGGTFANAVSPTGQAVARKNLAAFSMETGALLSGWKVDAGNVVRALVSDGTSLYVGGNYLKIGGVSRSRLAKVDVASGAVDPTFAPTFDNSIRALDLSASGLYAGGQFLTVNGVAKNRLVKLNPSTGAVDTTFTGSAGGAVYALKSSPVANVLYVAGNFSTLSSTTRTGVGAVNATTGAITGPAFASSAKPTFGLDITPNGATVFGAGGGPTNAAAAWATDTGTRKWRIVTDGDNQAIRWFGGTVYFGFHDGYQGDAHVHLLAADAATGALNTSFVPSIVGFWGVWALDVTDEGVVAGGDFTSVSGVPARGVARFPRTGDLPAAAPVSTAHVGTTTAWSYRDTGSAPTGWNTEGFDDSSWPTGLAQLGYGDGDEQTVLSYGPSASSKYLAYYFRTRFRVDQIPDQLALQVAADDGAVAYLNGVEVARDNMPAGTITSTTRASSGRSGGAENALRQFAVDPGLLHTGVNTLAVEVHQDTPSSTDLTFDASLTGTVVAAPNEPPVAAFTSSVSGYTVSFDGTTSSDPDGTVSGWRWDFGDGTTASGSAVQHTYAGEGAYTVTLRVTDDGGAHDTVVRTQTVLSPTVTTVPIAANASWQWWYATNAPAAGWSQPGFDDSAWATGAAVLGFGSSTVATTIDTFASPSVRPKTAYFRRTFTVDDPSRVQSALVSTVADDGVAVYVNGVEVGRANLPAGTLTSTLSASSARSSTTAANNPSTFVVPVSLLTKGVNTVAAETHVNTRATTDLTFKATLTLTSLR